MKLLPIWAQAAIGLVIVAVIFGAGWKTASWKASGKIATLTAERDAAILERDEKRAFAVACIADVATISKSLTDLQDGRDLLQTAYDEATSRPPEVVIRYRDRWRDAENVIVSEDCPTAVGELIGFLHTLPALEPDEVTP